MGASDDPELRDRRALKPLLMAFQEFFLDEIGHQLGLDGRQDASDAKAPSQSPP